MGVIANVQPSFIVTDRKFANEVIPKHILPYSYCWKTLLNKGIHVSGGSDAPVENVSPFKGIIMQFIELTQIKIRKVIYTYIHTCIH